jgi:protein-L-isoaspartate O-methyltransferase
MIIPVGRQYSHQELKLVIKNQQGDIEVKDILSVVFVPFQGERNE